MYCSRCGAFCPAEDHYCQNCGAPLYQSYHAKKGRHWVPILFMVILSLLGTAVYLASSIPEQTTDIPDTTPWYTNENGVLSFNESLYIGPEELIIPEVVGGEYVTALSERCFAGCKSITTVILPDSLNEIGKSAFSRCDRLRAIYIPSGVTAIGNYAFFGCPSLEAISIPDSVTEMGTQVFQQCDKLNCVFYGDTFARWQTLYPEKIAENTKIVCSDGEFPLS